MWKFLCSRRCHQVPRLPGKTKVDVTCHACHANGTSMSPSATPATQSAAASWATSGDQAGHQTQPNAISATPATKRRLMSPSAMVATQMERGCRQVPRLPCKVPRLHCHKGHTCHAKRRLMSPSATSATQNEGQCRQVPDLPRKVLRRHGRLTATERATRPSPAQ